MKLHHCQTQSISAQLIGDKVTMSRKLIHRQKILCSFLQQ